MNVLAGDVGCTHAKIPAIGQEEPRGFRSGPALTAGQMAMEAPGGYKGGKMLFLGLGTGLGTAMIVDGIIELPPRGRLGDDTTAFLGGFRLWQRAACRKRA